MKRTTEIWKERYQASKKMDRTELSLNSNINGLKNLIESNTNELKEEIKWLDDNENKRNNLIDKAIEETMNS